MRVQTEKILNYCKVCNKPLKEDDIHLKVIAGSILCLCDICKDKSFEQMLAEKAEQIRQKAGLSA